MYELTECKRVSYLPPGQINTKPSSAGIPMPNIEVFIVNEQGKKVGPNIARELIVHVPNVMHGYWENTKETDKRLKTINGSDRIALYTNDIFTMDEEGYLYFIRRNDDTIKVKGEEVSPKEIEDAIAKFPGVKQVAVIGIPDHKFGNKLKAIVVPNNNVKLNEKTMLHFCSIQLEENLVPHQVEFKNNIPLTLTGKIKNLQ